MKKLACLTIIALISSSAYCADTWKYTFKTDPITDKPAGYAMLEAEDSTKTQLVISCSQTSKKAILNYKLYFKDGIKIEDFYNFTSNFIVRADSNAAKEFSVYIPTELKLKVGIFENSFRPYVGKSQTILIRFPSLLAAPQTVMFNLRNLTDAETKMREHCKVK